LPDIIQDPIHWDIHADESCQNAHRFTVIGALYGRAEHTGKITNAIEEAIQRHGGTSEIKWSKLRKHNVRMYKAAIDAMYFAIRRDGIVKFHSIVVDNEKSDHKAYNEGDEDLGFTKYTFTLLFKFARMNASHTPPPYFYVHLDKRSTRYKPEVTQITLNYKDASRHGRDYKAYKLVHFVDSKKSRMIQMADLFTGIIAADWNREHSAPHKQELIDYVRKRWDLPGLNRSTPPHIAKRGIDIWFLDWEVGKKKAAPQT
jgi:hypothetical protein